MSAPVVEAVTQPAPDPIRPLPYAIDEEGCVCERCEFGTHLPLDQATTEERLAMILGQIRDNTGMSFLELHAWEQENCPEDLSIEPIAA